MNYVEYFWKQTIKEGYKKSLYYALIFGFFCIFAAEIYISYEDKITMVTLFQISELKMYISYEDMYPIQRTLILF